MRIRIYNLWQDEDNIDSCKISSFTYDRSNIVWKKIIPPDDGDI